MLKKDLTIDRDLYAMKYKILRRAITDKNYSPQELKDLCFSLEGETIEELNKIHKDWVGY